MSDTNSLCRRAFALLDRDGTLIVDHGYLSDPERIEFLPGVFDGLRALRDAGFGLVIVTNQSGIARGYFDQLTLDRIHERLTGLLAMQGICLEGIHVCPHGPNDGCHCRKPLPGLIQEAMLAHNIDLSRSVVIGDTAADMGAARAARVRGIQIPSDQAKPAARPFAVARDFGEAAAIAIEQLEKGVIPPCT
jgi:D-glycero-D-manno-heptose 1,7-bisphosphate phosphatase